MGILIRTKTDEIAAKRNNSYLASGVRLSLKMKKGREKEEAASAGCVKIEFWSERRKS